MAASPVETSAEPSTVCPDHLMSPSVTQLLGTVRVIDANLECIAQSDGSCNYAYTLRVAPLFQSSSSSSLSIASAPSSVKEPPATPRHIMESTTTEQSSMVGPTAGIHSTSMVSPLDVKFTMIVLSKSKRDMFISHTHSFGRYAILRDVIWHFHQLTSNIFTQDLLRRLSLHIGDKSRRIDLDDFERCLHELCHDNVDRIEIVVDKN